MTNSIDVLNDKVRKLLKTTKRTKFGVMAFYTFITVMYFINYGLSYYLVLVVILYLGSWMILRRLIKLANKELIIEFSKSLAEASQQLAHGRLQINDLKEHTKTLNEAEDLFELLCYSLSFIQGDIRNNFE